MGRKFLVVLYKCEQMLSLAATLVACVMAGMQQACIVYASAELPAHHAKCS